jgi:hypothetical protein
MKRCQDHQQSTMMYAWIRAVYCDILQGVPGTRSWYCEGMQGIFCVCQIGLVWAGMYGSGMHGYASREPLATPEVLNRDSQHVATNTHLPLEAYP